MTLSATKLRNSQVSSRDIILNSNGEKRLSEIANLPDFQFTKWCLKHYALNKGVYNTIDQRMHQAGYNKIVSRRKVLIAFLDYAYESFGLNEKHKSLKFGRGGLAELLEGFLNKKG